MKKEFIDDMPISTGLSFGAMSWKDVSFILALGPAMHCTVSCALTSWEIGTETMLLPIFLCRSRPRFKRYLLFSLAIYWINASYRSAVLKTVWRRLEIAVREKYSDQIRSPTTFCAPIHAEISVYREELNSWEGPLLHLKHEICNTAFVEMNGIVVLPPLSS